MKIKVVCLNLWLGGNLMPAALAFLKEQNADIVMLQEVFDGHDPSFPDRFRSTEVLQAELGYPHQTFAAAMLQRVEVGKVESGNAVLSKFPITTTNLTFFNETYYELDAYDPAYFPLQPRILQHITVDAKGQTLELFNMHGVWDMDGDNYSDRRKEMSQKIQAATKGKQHVILAGDSNAKHTNQAMRLLEKNLVNVFGNELTTSFNMRRKDNPGYATAVVDLMYVSPDIKVLAKECPNVDASDHLPLVVTLDIPA